MKNLDKLKTILFSVILLIIGLSVVSAWTGPTTTPTGDNKAAPITTLGNQYKTGGLAMGTTSTTNLTSTTAPFKLDVVGKILTTGLAIVGGSADIAGTIKTDTLEYTKTNTTDPNKGVCVGEDGILTLCSNPPVTSITIPFSPPGYEYTSDQNLPYHYYIPTGYERTFTVPIGVKDNKITVEMFGAGGAGEGNQSTDGGDSYFSFRTGSSSFTVVAGGGNVGISPNSGQGGSYSVPTNSKISNVVNVSGRNSYATSTSTQGGNYSSSTPCGSYYAIHGGPGGAGEQGGISGPNGWKSPYNSGSAGSFSNIGTGGAGSDYVVCGNTYAKGPGYYILDYGDYGISGLPGNYPGGGGGGHGGTGGISDMQTSGSPSSWPLPDRFWYNGEDGGKGGGAGAYVKFDVAVNPGEVYYLKAGKGGKGLDDCGSKGTYPTYRTFAPPYESGHCGTGWPQPGDGADGLINISYE